MNIMMLKKYHRDNTVKLHLSRNFGNKNNNTGNQDAASIDQIIVAIQIATKILEFKKNAMENML